MQLDFSDEPTPATRHPPETTDFESLILRISYEILTTISVVATDCCVVICDEGTRCKSESPAAKSKVF